MSLNLQQHVLSILQHQSGLGFMGVQVRSVFGDAVQTSVINSALYLFLLADASLYVGVVAVIGVLGTYYARFTARQLSIVLLRVSGGFIYCAVVLNLLGLGVGSDFISTCSISLFEGSYTYTLWSQISKLIMLLTLGALYTLFPAVLQSKMRLIELPLLLQVSAALCATIISSTNFALLLLALEGFSLTLYIMTALGRTYGGVTAAVKYFAFGTLGSVFLFWGTVHIYALVPSLSFEVANVLLLKAHDESHELSTALNFATTAIAFGFMLKLGAAPAHQWVADVYAGAHMYITAFFSVFVKLVLFVVFLQLAARFNSDTLLVQFTLFSLAVGCFMSINQTEIKRFLAYSSIVHVAFLFMGDTSAALIYLLSYVVSSLVIFSVLLSAQLGGKELIYMNDLKFLRGSSLFNVWCIVVALASSAGLPPFAGFYGKFLVWTSLIEDIYISNSLDSYCILFVSISISLVTIYYYMRIIAYLFVGEDSQDKCSTSNFLTQPAQRPAILSQAAISFVVLFWTFLQPYILPIVNFFTLQI
jgi:NADH-quinone oxidoreductase subunit N